MFTKLIDALKATRRTIVFTEGPDARILEATDRLLKDDLMDVILIGNVDEVKAAAEKGNFCICKATIIDPATYEGMDEMVAKMVELRKGKMSEEDCRAALAKGNYFGTMLVKMGKADALLGGATHSTADTVRPARSPSPARRSWQRSPSSPRVPRSSSASTRRLRCSPSPRRAAARAARLR